MPSLITHLDIADQCLQAAKLDKTSWLDYNSYISGSVTPDLGYFNPHESFFTQLSHSRKNRRVVKEFFKESTTPQEKSFTLGFLSHLISDKIMEKLVYWKSDRMFNKPWYMIKKTTQQTKLPQTLHHQRIEWSLDIDILNTPHGKQLLKKSILFPAWSKHNLITTTYKKLFNLDVDYLSLNSSFNSLNKLKPRIIQLASLTGLKNILGKRYYPLEKIGYHIIRKTALLLSNLKNDPIYFWSFLDPCRLDQKQKTAFLRLKDRSIKKFVRYIKFSPYIQKKYRPK